MKQNKIHLVFLFILGITFYSSAQVQKYQPTFESLEKVNPVPEWFKDAKFGIYFHWGVFSVPAYSNEWYPRTMYFTGSAENKHHIETYGDITEWPYNNFITGAKDKQGNWVQFAPKLKLNGGQFDPDEWAQLFADAGAKFAGPVAEHHDGYSMWASKVNPWNANDMGPKIDLVGLLTDAIHKKDMKIILSMHHAFNITGFYEAVPKTTDTLLQKLYGQQGKEKNEAFWLAKHKEIIDKYKPDIIWQDFNLPSITQHVLFEFLAYYYNKASDWNKEVVATYKDGFNTKCAVLDFERGGATDITPYYWLTDDAISSTSWCYTEGLQYYSTKQILHGFLDRISKNGNLLLNISPKADGSIPQEQKDILLSMGAWLKKYGESVYATRAWEVYGEGPTKMGADHGVFTAPAEGTSYDIRFTRNKDNTIIYAFLLGWDKDQKEFKISSLGSDRISCKNLKSVELIDGEAGKYRSLSFQQNTDGLIVNLPPKTFDELAYVVKLSFEGKIPNPDKFADINCIPHYYLEPYQNKDNLVLGADMALTAKRRNQANQWTLESLGKGYYKIMNRENGKKVIECSNSGQEIGISEFSGKDNQVWKIENSYFGKLVISNKKFIKSLLSVNTAIAEGSKASVLNAESDSIFGWSLKEVCEMKQTAYKVNAIPGTIEAEDFDNGCQGEAYNDNDDNNRGGKYRLNSGVDIEVCTAGSFNVGWTNTGEFMSYTVNVNKSATYNVLFYVASGTETAKMHLECDGIDKTGLVTIANTMGYQNWVVVKQTIKLEAGEHILKFVIDGAGVNLDKIMFNEQAE